MDGVPFLTQDPIPVAGEFLYEFDALDAGTFWYHPHQRSSEQVGRGLYGPLIVEEADPIRVDRDLTWMLDDWRMTRDGQIAGDFGSRHDAMHGGRIGNSVTINGQMPERIAVRSGERIRLRLINTANARIFGLDFGALEPVVVALDGQPVTPHVPDSNIVVIGPAMRVDLVIDMTGKQPAGRTGHGVGRAAPDRLQRRNDGADDDGQRYGVDDGPDARGQHVVHQRRSRDGSYDGPLAGPAAGHVARVRDG